MKTKKVLVCGIITVIFALAFAGCGDPEGGATGGGLTDLGGEITFTVTDENGTTKTSGYTTGDELSVSYDGTEVGVTYQWYKDGTAITGETNATYTPIEEGTYTVTVSAAGYKPKTSGPITVTGETLLILSGTVSITPNVDVITGTELTAVYSGEEDVTISYQWYKDGEAILNETNETYTPTEAGSYAVRASAANYAGKRSAPVTVNWPTPVAEDFTIGNLIQTIVTGITEVTITPKEDKSAGTITVYYNGSTTLPSAVGEYPVTFDVAAAEGWNAATGLHAGTLTIITAIPYIITGSGTSFTATKNGETVGTADQPIQTTINAIRTDADEEDVAIQFGDGESDLDIGTAYAAFNNTGGEWGDTIYLWGKITSTNNTGGQGTIMVGSGVSVTSIADIANTANTSINDSKTVLNNGTLTISGGTLLGFGVIQNESTGNLEIAGGTISVTPKGSNTTGIGVRNNGGTVTISGGILEATEDAAFPRTVLNDGNSPGTVNITGGAISAILGVAVQNAGTGNGTINISGGTVTSIGNGIAVRNTAGGTLNISGTAHIISLSHIQTQATVTNQGSGMLNISGGIVDNTTIGIAVRNHGTGKITISGNAVITSKNTEKIVNDENTVEGTIALANSGTATDARLVITGGTISNTSTGIAVYNESTGAVTISGGTISTVSGFAVQNTNANAGAITLSGGPTITGSIRPAAAGRLSVDDFNPGAHVYTLDYAAYTDGMIAVTGGGSFLSKFALHNQPAYVLGVSDGNLVANFVKQTPTAADYNFDNRNQTAGSVTAVTITPKTDAPEPSAIYYAGSTTIPQTAGTYAVTFDVAATAGWNAATGLSAGNLIVSNPTPKAEDYDIGNLNQTVAIGVSAVTITPKDGKSTGARTIYYTGTDGTTYLKSTTLPTAVGTYAVTFDVAAAAGWNAATGLSAGTLTVTAVVSPYIITGSGNAFTATRGGETVGTGLLQIVINTIRTDAAGNAASIQFGNETEGLNIGTAAAQFNNTGGTWGVITLSGKITSSADTTLSQGTIMIGNPVSVISTADIANTGGTNGRAIYNVNMNGTVTISGGTVSATSGHAINNNSSGALTISGGTVKATTGYAVYNASTGTITVSGSAVVTSANITTGGGTIFLANSGTDTTERLIINGGTVQNTANSASSRTVYNSGTGALTISGGTVEATAGYAVYNASTGTITVSGSAVVTSANTTTGGGTIFLANSGTATTERLIINGGTVQNTASDASSRAVNNSSTGGVIISGGTVSATTGYAVYNDSNGTITVSGSAVVTSANTNTTGGTIYSSSIGTTAATWLVITDGTVSNTSTGNAIYNANVNAISISGGTITASSSGYAVISTTTSTTANAGAITLGGNPTITGRIRPSATGRLSVTTSAPAFDPSPTTKKYTLDYAAYATGNVAVAGGASFESNFELYNQPTYDLIVSGNNLGIQAIVPFNYIITGSGTSFTATRSGETVGTGAIQAVITAIQTNAEGKNATIQFGSGGTNVLDIGTASAQFNSGTWGVITLSGKITSANATTSQGTVLIGNGVSVISTADIADTSTGTNGRAIYNTNTDTGGTVTINGGTVSTTSGRAIHNNSSGVLTISGGTVSATTGRAINNNSTGALTISGGTVSATTGYAVYNDSNGTITVSGNAVVTSANTSTTQGTIYRSDSSNATTGTWLVISDGTVRNTSTGNAIYNNNINTITISGGTVENTSTGNAVYNNSTGTITINGGAITASSGNAVYNNSTGTITINGGTITASSGYAVISATTSTTSGAGVITLGGNPTINGRIRPSAAGRLRVTTSGATSFAPSPVTKRYTLDYASYAAHDPAVTYGAEFLQYFVLHQSEYVLGKGDTNLVIISIPTSADPSVYVITRGGSSFTATKGSEVVGQAATDMSNVITAIRTNAAGNAASIQFGNGTEALNIGTTYAEFNNTGGTWGVITLSGKITSANATTIATTNRGTVLIGNGVTVISTADITNTGGENGRAIYNDNSSSSTGGTVTISSGTVSATTGYAINNTGGALTISGGTVSTETGRAINSSGTVTISGGTVSTTTGYAVYYDSNGTVNISGGTVKATSGSAVYNSFTGTVNISGGRVEATTGYAVNNSSNGKITVSGSAVVTSANTNTSRGTIYSTTTVTTSTNDTWLEISGGTVSNTSTQSSNVIYHASTKGISISGGTITASSSGYAVYSYNSTSVEAITLSGNPTITGRIRPVAPGKLRVTTSAPTFAPGTKVYTLDYAAYAAGDIAVTGGASFLANFTLYNQTAWKLAASNGNLVIAAN